MVSTIDDGKGSSVGVPNANAARTVLESGCAGALATGGGAERKQYRMPAAANLDELRDDLQTLVDHPETVAQSDSSRCRLLGALDAVSSKVLSRSGGQGGTDFESLETLRALLNVRANFESPRGREATGTAGPVARQDSIAVDNWRVAVRALVAVKQMGAVPTLGSAEAARP